MQKLKTMLTAVFTLLVIGVNAQTEMAKPLKNIMRLEGKWSGDAQLVLDGNTFKFTYFAEFKKTADGNGLLMEEWFESPELGKLSGSNLIGYNSNDGKIHWFSVDNFGTAHDHTGEWKSDDHFYMETTELKDKSKYVEMINIHILDKDKMQLDLNATLDGKQYEKVEVTFHRRNNF